PASTPSQVGVHGGSTRLRPHLRWGYTEGRPGFDPISGGGTRGVDPASTPSQVGVHGGRPGFDPTSGGGTRGSTLLRPHLGWGSMGVDPAQPPPGVEGLGPLKPSYRTFPTSH